MVKNIKDCDPQVPKAGIGPAANIPLTTPEEMYGAARFFGKSVIAPGSRLKFHVHNGECEFYYIIKGKAKYSDNGTEVILGPGDVTKTFDGEGHSIENIGDEDLEFVALIPIE